MYLGYIMGFIFLPVSILLFLTQLGFSKMNSLLGFPLVIIGAIGIILVEVGDIIDSHIQGNAFMVYFTAFILMLPGIIFLLSLIIDMPKTIVAALPLIIASFLFVEGISSFHIGES